MMMFNTNLVRQSSPSISVTENEKFIHWRDNGREFVPVEAANGRPSKMTMITPSLQRNGLLHGQAAPSMQNNGLLQGQAAPSMLQTGMLQSQGMPSIQRSGFMPRQTAPSVQRTGMLQGQPVSNANTKALASLFGNNVNGIGNPTFHNAMNHPVGNNAMNNLVGNTAMNNVRGNNAMNNMVGNTAMNNVRGSNAMNNMVGNNAAASMNDFYRANQLFPAANFQNGASNRQNGYAFPVPSTAAPKPTGWARFLPENLDAGIAAAAAAAVVSATASPISPPKPIDWRRFLPENLAAIANKQQSDHLKGEIQRSILYM